MIASAPDQTPSLRFAAAVRAAAFLCLFFVVLPTLLPGARLRGHVRHEFLDQIPVGGAVIELVDSNDPSQTDSVVTDPFGYFVTTAFDAGDVIQITATHPSYQQETPEVTLASADHFEAILMTPLGDVMTDFHDIIVQISGAVSQLPLVGVPVEITRWDAADGGNVISTHHLVTDAKGAAFLRSARTGFYEFKLNDSSRPAGERRARYEDYATPPGGRVSITKNHIVNVYLKPHAQDLRVLVIGREFERAEDDVPLGDVLVQIRGLDPGDLKLEVLHARSDYTKLFPPGPPPTVTNDQFLISDGEVVFQGLPPIAYEVKLSRLGYVTQKILLTPDPVTGLLAHDYDNPLTVSLRAEQHNLDVLVELPAYVGAIFDEQGLPANSGISALGLRVRVIGLEGTNTDGIQFQAFTGQNLNGETYAPIFEPMLPGRYRVLVDGLCTERPRAFDADLGYFRSVGQSFDVVAFGESIVEIPPGYTGSTPRIHRHTVTLQTPTVLVRGQLLEADDVDPSQGTPIFRPFAHQTLELTSNALDDLQTTPTSVTIVTDGEGRFTARVLPGLYGIRAPGLTDHYGDTVIVRVAEAAKPTEANRSRSYAWPLVDAFPIPVGSSSLAETYFGLSGIPIHAAREQHLELRLRRERYTIEASGTEQTELDTKIIARTSEGETFSVPYSPTLAAQTSIQLQGSSGNRNAPVTPPPPNSFTSNPLHARWENLPPGDYSGITATVAGHEFESTFDPKTFIDWPIPGEAPDAAQAALFEIDNLPQGEGLHRPLSPVQAASFSIAPTSYEPVPYQIFVWETREVDGETVSDYQPSGSSSSGSPIETSAAPGLFEGSAALGGPVTAVWTTGRNDMGEEYPVRMTPGGSLFLGGPGATTRSDLPTLSYSLRLDGVSADDSNLRIDGAHFQLGTSGTPILTGQTLTGLQELPSVGKAPGDNFFVQFGTTARIVGNGSSPDLAITVGLSQGLQIDATLRDMSPIGIGGTPLDIPAEAVEVEIRNRHGLLVATAPTDADGRVTFNSLPAYADYFLTVGSRGYVPVRHRLRAIDATPGNDSSTAARHEVTQDLELLARPVLHEPGIPLNRWGLFLPTVSRSGGVDAAAGVNDFDFFRAREELTATWKIEAIPTTVAVTLPGFDDASGSPLPDDEINEPDPIIAAYLIDERRFQRDGFVGGTDPLEDETIFSIPHGDNSTDLPVLAAILRDTTQIQPDPNSTFFTAKFQRRVFVDPADTIELDPETGRTVVTGTLTLWDLPPGDFAPVIVLETQRGAYRVYEVPYEGNDGLKRLRGPSLPPWFAGILDLFGIASGVANTQSALEDAIGDYVPDGTFVPLPDFSATISLDPDENDPEAGYLRYAYSIGVGHKIGEDSVAAGVLGLGPGVIGVDLAAVAELAVDGRSGETKFSVTGTASKESFIDESYLMKIAPLSGTKPTFPKATGAIESGISTNWPLGAGLSDPLKFSVQTSTAVGANARVEAVLNNYARAIPYAGPVIGFLGDTQLAELTAGVNAAASVRQTLSLTTEFPRERKVRSRDRDEPVPRQSFLGEAVITPAAELCIGVGFGTDLTLSAFGGYSKAEVRFKAGGNGCSVDPDISAMELKFNTTSGWPFITEISGEVSVTATASGGAGPVSFEREWELAKAGFKVQFGTETVVYHHAVDTEFNLVGPLSAGEGTFTSAGPDLVGGVAPTATYTVNGPLSGSFAYTAHNAALGTDVMRLARRTGPFSWSDDVLEIDLGPDVVTATSLTLADGRVLVAYARIFPGADRFDAYSDHIVFTRLIATDGTVGPETALIFLSNPPSELLLAESGNLVELYTKAAATDGVSHFRQVFLTPFDKATGTWGSTQFRVNEADDFALHLAVGGADGASEIVLHWVTTSGVWKWMRSSDSVQHTVPGDFAAAPASWATASFTEIVIPTRDGTIKRYGQSPFTGSPGAKEAPLVSGVDAVEVALTQQAVTATGGYLLVWVNRANGVRQLSYLTYDPAGIPTTEPLPLTANPSGRYSRLRLTQQHATAAYAFAQFSNDDFSSLRFFEIDVLSGLSGNDSDHDGLPDLAELRLVDARPADAIETVDHVLDGDDFDGDGASNGDEIRAGSDPLDRLSVPPPPGPPTVSLAVVDATAAEWQAQPAQFLVQRDGPTSTELPITLTTTGSATADVDYLASPSPLVLGIGESSRAVTVTPLADELAEGPEEIVVTLQAHESYELGSPSSVTLSLADRPSQQWRFERFGAAANAPLALFSADNDLDGIVNLLEYAFLLDPNQPDGPGAPVIAIHEVEGQAYLELSFTVNRAAIDTEITLEGSADLLNFIAAAAYFAEASRTTHANGTETIVLRSVVPVDQLPLRFFRLKVEQP